MVCLRSPLYILIFCATTGCSLVKPGTESSDEAAVASMVKLKTPQEALTLAQTITDPIFRASAVQTWVEAHRAEIPPNDARKLCDTLRGESANHCWHIYSAAHLR